MAIEGSNPVRARLVKFDVLYFLILERVNQTTQWVYIEIDKSTKQYKNTRFYDQNDPCKKKNLQQIFQLKSFGY